MRSKVKRCKLLIYVLILALILPISISKHEVYAAVGHLEDETTPSVIVYNSKDLVQAVDNAEDGDIIGIASNICIESGIGMLGSDDKRITIIRMSEGAFIHMYLSADVEMKNIIFDGNSSVYNREYNPMIHIEGKAEFENVTFQNCYNQWAGGAIVAESGEVNITGCHFTNNQAGEGGHIVVHSSAHVKATNSIFENGVSTRSGGAAKIESSYEAKGKIEFIACKIFENQARYGGAIANKGSVKITDSIIYGNTAETGADFLNYSGSSFEMDSIEELLELYATDGIRPLEWENDYVDKAYIEGDIEKENPLSAMKLIYEKVSQEDDSELENPENNTGNTDKTPNDDNNQDGQQTENNDSSTDDGNNDNSENKDDFSDNNSANGDSNIANESKGDNQSEDKQDEQNQLPSDVTDSEQNKPSDSSANENNSDNSTAADLDSNTEKGNTENDSKENQDKQDNQGGLVNNGDSSSDSGKNDSENGNSNSNVSNVPVESGNQTNNNIDKPNTDNEGSASDLKPGDNKQPGGTVNNENQGGTLAGNASNNQNQSNNIVADNGNNTVNKYPSDNINSGSGSSTGNGNTSDNTFQSEGNVSIQPEDSNNSGSSDKEGTATINDNSQTVASDRDNGNSSKEPTVTKKKTIKKLTITAKKGKHKITGKSIKRATVKVKIGKKTYKVKSNAKGKFTIKLKGKTKLKKGQKIKITISKTGYKTKHKTYKVK